MIVDAVYSIIINTMVVFSYVVEDTLKELIPMMVQSKLQHTDVVLKKS